jgi:hypothetical protein
MNKFNEAIAKIILNEELSDDEIAALSIGSDLVSPDAITVTVSDIIQGENDEIESVDLVRRTAPMGDSEGPDSEPTMYRKNVQKDKLRKYDVG